MCSEYGCGGGGIFHFSLLLHNMVHSCGRRCSMISVLQHSMAEGVTVCYREYGGGGGMMNDQGGTPARLLPNGCLPGRVLGN